MDPSGQLKNVELWCQGKPFFIRALAREFVTGADTIYQFTNHMKPGGKFGIPTDLDLQTWLRLYKMRRKTISNVLSNLECRNLYSKFMVYLIDKAPNYLRRIRASNRIIQTKPIIRKHQIVLVYVSICTSNVACFFTSVFDRLVKAFEFSQIKDIKLSFGKSSNIHINFHKSITIEQYFIINIMLGAWFLYGDNHVILFRKAQYGDWDALEKLLRLDSSLQYDPRISRLIHKEYMNNPFRYKEILSWLEKGPKVKITPALIKIRQAAFLSGISLSYHTLGGPPPLTAPDLLGLFDAFAKDRGIGDVDPDLAEFSPESFAKAIQRGRAFWTLPQIQPPDKK